MLRDHRGMRLTRRMKAVFWWCYTHSPHPQPAATILATMPTDAALESAWYHASQTHQATGTIPGWGDAICFNELHHTTPYHNTWDSPQQHEMSYNPWIVVCGAHGLESRSLSACVERANSAIHTN